MGIYAEEGGPLGGSMEPIILVPFVELAIGTRRFATIWTE